MTSFFHKIEKSALVTQGRRTSARQSQCQFMFSFFMKKMSKLNPQAAIRQVTAATAASTSTIGSQSASQVTQIPSSPSVCFQSRQQPSISGVPGEFRNRNSLTSSEGGGNRGTGGFQRNSGPWRSNCWRCREIHPFRDCPYSDAEFPGWKDRLSPAAWEAYQRFIHRQEQNSGN